jgi:TolB protein
MAVALLASSALAFAPVPADAPKAEKIVFTSASADGKTIAIVVMNPDGSKRTTLTKDDARELDPALSPDGRRIAFVTSAKDDRTGDVWVMSLDGKQRKKLTEHPPKTIAVGVSWSPNGRRIAYSTIEDLHGPPKDAKITVMDADGKNAKVVGPGLLPAFSPDGKKILYTVADPANMDEPRLAVMDTDGQNVKRLTATRALMGSWSPDGKKIAYIGESGAQKGSLRIYVSNADGSGATQLAKDGGEYMELAPRWSADGKRIYFNRLSLKNLVAKGGAPRTGIHVMDAGGGDVKELTKPDGMDLLGGAGLFVLEFTAR